MDKSLFAVFFGEDALPNILELTFVAIILYLLLSRSGGAASLIKATSGAYISGVKALQGR